MFSQYEVMDKVNAMMVNIKAVSIPLDYEDYSNDEYGEGNGQKLELKPIKMELNVDTKENSISSMSPSVYFVKEVSRNLRNTNPNNNAMKEPFDSLAMSRANESFDSVAMKIDQEMVASVSRQMANESFDSVGKINSISCFLYTPAHMERQS